MMATKTVDEYDWYSKTDLSQYIGKWIIILEDKVVLSGKSLKSLLKEFKQSYPGKKPFVAKIPSSDVLLW